MLQVLVAGRTELLALDPLRMQAAVLVREVVPVFALGAFENDFFSRHLSSTVVRGQGSGARGFL
jgi:hypothetical protein